MSKKTSTKNLPNEILFYTSVQKLGFLGAPEKSRTPNLQIRSLALYPIELRALYKIKLPIILIKM